MGIFSFLSGAPKRFVSRGSYERNIVKHSTMTPQTLAHLRQYNVTPKQALKLEFFFYTNTASKASALAEALTVLKYDVEHRPSTSDEKIQLITGWSLPMLMREDVVVEWTKLMCTVGFENDCDFDGWGTSPAQ